MTDQKTEFGTIGCYSRLLEGTTPYQNCISYSELYLDWLRLWIILVALIEPCKLIHYPLPSIMHSILLNHRIVNVNPWHCWKLWYRLLAYFLKSTTEYHVYDVSLLNPQEPPSKLLRARGNIWALVGPQTQIPFNAPRAHSCCLRPWFQTFFCYGQQMTPSRPKDDLPSVYGSPPIMTVTA